MLPNCAFFLEIKFCKYLLLQTRIYFFIFFKSTQKYVFTFYKKIRSKHKN